MITIKKIFSAITITTVLLSLIALPLETNAQTVWETRTIIFPVIGSVTYYDDFGVERDGGARQHEGNDLMGRKMLPLVAAVDGTVNVSYPQESWGYSVTIRDKDGYSYHYLHMNNDTPGTDDGKGDGTFAYAVDINDGSRVVAGQLIGWMGDSGNAETTTAHLHFEIRRSDRTPISPYNSLKAAKKITVPVDRPQQSNEILPFGHFEGGSFISMGNMDSDSEREIIVGAGPGGGPHVRVVNQDGTPVQDFFPYFSAFRGGVDVASGDVNGDGVDEVITAPHSKGGPHVKIYSSLGVEIGGFMAYDSKFQGGVNIAAADIDGDGKDEIITSPGKGGGPHIRVFKMNGTEILSFFAYDKTFTGGVDVTAYSEDNISYIITAPGMGGGPHIKVFDKTGMVSSEFLAYDPGHRGGVRIAMAKKDSSVQIITVPSLGGPQAKSFNLSGVTSGSDWGFEQWWSGSWDVAADGNSSYISTNLNTRRRASIRKLDFNQSFDRRR